MLLLLRTIDRGARHAGHFQGIHSRTQTSISSCHQLIRDHWYFLYYPDNAGADVKQSGTTKLEMHPPTVNRVPVPICVVDDDIPENDEEFRVSLFGEGGTFDLGDLTSVPIIILDNDRTSSYYN